MYNTVYGIQLFGFKFDLILSLNPVIQVQLTFVNIKMLDFEWCLTWDFLGHVMLL